MSRFDRVKQWAAFSRNWHIYDAKWQNPFTSAKVITRVLQGRNKAVYHPMNDSGDHVVVINSKHIALLGREWQYRVYYHHTGYPAAFKHMGAKNGKLWIPAWQLHERDPTLILWKAVYNNMENTMAGKLKKAGGEFKYFTDKMGEHLREMVTDHKEEAGKVEAVATLSEIYR